MADEVASVSLEADSSSFDESLDASQSKMDEWGKSITDSVGPANQLFQTLTSRVEGFSSKLVAFASSANEKLAGFADLSNEQIGKSLGTVAGAGLGSFLGPAGAQIGSLLGDQIGGALSDTVDFKALAGEAQAFLDSVRPLFDQITGWWGEVFGDAKETFGKIKDIVGELGLGDLLSGDLGTAWDKITTAFDGVVMEWEGFVNRFAARVVGAMDSLWSAVKEPLAKVADFIQRLLVRIGVLDAGTEKWGDTIRSIQEIGKTVFGAIAYAVGYVGGVFKVVGGYIGDYLVAPLIGFMENVFGVITTVFEKIAKNVGGMIGRTAQEVAEFSKQAEESLKAAKESVRAASEEGKNVSPDAKGKALQNSVTGGVDRGRADLDRRQQMKEYWQPILEGAGSAIADFLAKGVQKIDQMADLDVAIGTGGTAQTLIEGSREAASAIAKARGEGSMMEKQLAAQERAAAAAEATALKIEDMKGQIESLNRKFDGVESV